MADVKVTFMVEATVPDSTTLARMDFLGDVIRQNLQVEQIEVEEVSWYDRTEKEGGGQ